MQADNSAAGRRHSSIENCAQAGSQSEPPFGRTNPTWAIAQGPGRTWPPDRDCEFAGGGAAETEMQASSQPQPIPIGYDDATINWCALMKLYAVLGLILSLAVADLAYAVTRIRDDMGGSLGKYLLMFTRMRDSGERVIIDGNCFSACTLVTISQRRGSALLNARCSVSMLGGSTITRASDRPAQKGQICYLNSIHP